MLTHPTLEKRQQLKLTGMVQALREQLQMPEITELSFDERLGLLVDRELTHREDRRLTHRLRTAPLRQTACIEDIDYRHPRGLDKSVMTRLAPCQWGRDRHHVLITGPTGIGKTWLACALGHQACREGLTALSLRLPRLLQELPVAKVAGRYVKVMGTLATTDVLILDDWALAPLSEENRREVWEVLEDRHDRRATLITSQLPLEHWHAALGEPPLADAILERLVHNAYKIVLPGESMRKRLATQKPSAPKASLGASGWDVFSCRVPPAGTDNQEDHRHDATQQDASCSRQRRRTPPSSACKWTITWEPFRWL